MPKPSRRPKPSSVAARRRSKRRPTHVLHLYISGMTPAAIRAVQNLRQICEEHLAGTYELEVVDIYQQPVLAKGQQIVAVPTLVRKLPLPMRRVIGDLSDSQRVLMGLDVRPVSGAPSKAGAAGGAKGARK